MLRIIRNPDFLAVAGFTALGLVLTLGLMSALRVLGELTNRLARQAAIATPERVRACGLFDRNSIAMVE